MLRKITHLQAYFMFLSTGVDNVMTVCYSYVQCLFILKNVKGSFIS